MILTKLRVARLNWKLSEFLMNDKDTQDLYKKGKRYKGGEVAEDKFFHSFITNICEVVVSSIVNGEPTYILTEHYLDISYLDVYITSKKFIIINLDEVWELSKKLVTKF